VAVAFPVVSIGFPVYNGEKYMRDALDSLLAQTFTAFELIISDNASTDATQAICLEYAARDSRIRYLRQAENLGAAGNFRFVLAEAVAGYFMWASADDRWDVGWLAALADKLDDGISIAFGSSMGFLDDGRTDSLITFRSLKGPRALRMLRYYLWSEEGQKANVIYGLYRIEEIRAAAAEVFAAGDENRVGFDIVLVFTMLRTGGLHIEPGVTLYKRSKRGVIEFSTGKLLTLERTAAFLMHLTRLELLPYLFEHGQRSPAGLTRLAICAVTPLKFLLMICTGLGPAAALFLRRVKAKWADAVRT
jgi:glycosyltransferase involved in cell wall biosynthesis